MNSTTPSRPLTLEAIKLIYEEAMEKWGDPPSVIKLHPHTLRMLSDSGIFVRRTAKETVMGMDYYLDPCLEPGEIKVGKIVKGEFVEQCV